MNSSAKKVKYEQLILKDHFDDQTTLEVLKIIGDLIDWSFELKDSRGTGKAIEIASSYQHRDLSTREQFILNYFIGNAWSDLYYYHKTDAKYEDLIWNSKEIENAIICYRKALNTLYDQQTQNSVEPSMICRTLTNLGNQLSHVGRVIEAISYWNHAINIDPNFLMAIGNRGMGLHSYARCLYDDGHSHVIHQFALKDLRKATQKPNQETLHAHQKFKEYLDSYRKHPGFKKEFDFDLENWSLGDTEEEIKYREWCLNKTLFINPLNDLGTYSIAARDILHLPSIVTDISEGPHFYGMFNQIKQEFVSARYLFFEAQTSNKPHFSDKDVFLYNTLDYPSYGLSIEKIKAAIRMSYSLLDKIAFFVNRYFNLGFEDSNIKFHTIWFKHKKKGGVARDSNGEAEIHDKLEDLQNWAVRGLVWLSKDLKNNSPLRKSLDPDAQLMDQIRHHIEHLYLKVIDEQFPNTRVDNPEDKPTLLVSRKQISRSGLKLLQTVRAGMIYLSLAVELEERRRKHAHMGTNQIIGHMQLHPYKDTWKI